MIVRNATGWLMVLSLVGLVTAGALGFHAAASGNGAAAGMNWTAARRTTQTDIRRTADDKKVFTPLLPPYAPRERMSRLREEPLRVAGIVPSASNTLVELKGPPGKRYEVQSTPNLVGVAWRKIGSATMGVDGAVEFTDPGATDARYYRIAKPKAKADYIAAISILLLGL